MGQRATKAALEKIQERPFTTKLLEFTRELSGIFSWKSLRGTPVFPQVHEALKNTALLTTISLALSLLIGFLFLFTAEIYPKTQIFLDRLANGINTTPIFLLGIFLIWLFAFALRLFPAGGDQSTRDFILPALSIALKFGSRLFLLLSQYMRELDTKVFILRARAYALPSQRIFFHKLANCVMPFIIFWLIETASLFSGAVIVETLFSIHGLGSLLIFSLLQYDIHLLFVNLTVIATIVYITSLLQKELGKWQHTGRI
ncbi:MAG: hypothetical protein LDLANPLL_02252 [Turneriella sp.]|nr:hypothetical protein [Turneriella sp.]